MRSSVHDLSSQDIPVPDLKNVVEHRQFNKSAICELGIENIPDRRKPSGQRVRSNLRTRTYSRHQLLTESTMGPCHSRLRGTCPHDSLSPLPAIGCTLQTHERTSCAHLFANT